jgi:hypothetical protein
MQPSHISTLTEKIARWEIKQKASDAELQAARCCIAFDMQLLWEKSVEMHARAHLIGLARQALIQQEMGGQAEHQGTSMLANTRAPIAQCRLIGQEARTIALARITYLTTQITKVMDRELQGDLSGEIENMLMDDGEDLGGVGSAQDLADAEKDRQAERSERKTRG